MSEKDERRWRHFFLSWSRLKIVAQLEAFYSWCISIMVIARVFIA
jgi:hypothetical protein